MNDNKSKVKTYCYKIDCKYITTGFHLEQYPVCVVCHEEISSGLKQRIDDLRDDDTEESEDDSMTGWFEFL